MFATFGRFSVPHEIYTKKKKKNSTKAIDSICNVSDPGETTHF